MRKSFSAIIVCLTGAVLLAGCAKSESDIKDKPENSTVAVSEQKEVETKENEKNDEAKPGEEETPKGVPNLLLFRENAYEWKKDNTPAIKQSYTYLMLDGESAKSNSKLAESLKRARDEMFSKRKEAWDKDLEALKENGLFSFDDGWMVYLRRADEKYLSFVTEYHSEGMYDDVAYTEYMAHSYRVDDGKEITFSDVVADQDAFFDLLTEKMYGSIDSKLKEYYSIGLDMDKEKFEEDLKGYMRSGELAWTLDPFGVTCYLPAYKAALFAESGTIQFSEDSDKKIFNDEFRNSARNEYVIQIPDYAGSYIDINDSGVPSYVRASELYDYDAEKDDFYLSGLFINCANDVKSVPTTMPNGTDFYNIFLLHRDGETILLENHDEYDRSFINTYVLARHEVSEADSMRGCLEWASRKDYDINGEGYTPVYVPTDPSKIRILTGKGQFSGDWSPTVLNVGNKGKIAAEGKTESSDEYRVYYYLYSEGENVEESADKIILREVSCQNINDEDDEGPKDLIIDADTVFDESCDTSFFDGYRRGDTPLEWIHHARELEEKDPEHGPALLGVYDVSLTGNHVDRYYGSYWWD